MAVHARTRDILLPILLFPVALPVLISAVRASGYFLDGLEMDYIWPSLNVLIAYDVIYIGLAYMVFDYIVEE
jgi:heme exporter protein B